MFPFLRLYLSRVYILGEDDRLLVLARQPSDVAAFERWVARNAWEELNENSVAEVLPVHELVRSTSAARHLSDELRDKVARLNGKERREYFEQWRAKHVVDEVPADVKDHVVFCGTLQGAPYFLKPLASDADADGRIPQVCLLTHDPRSGPTNTNSNTLYGRASSTSPLPTKMHNACGSSEAIPGPHQAGKIAAGPRRSKDVESTPPLRSSCPT